MIATSAKETGQSDWLVQAYEVAIEHASFKSHLGVLMLKFSLALLFREYAYDFGKAEPFMEELAQVTSIKHHTPIEELEDCKDAITRDFCCVCVRKTLEAGREDLERNYLPGVISLFQVGLKPQDLREKVVYAERTRIYLALLYRLNGSIEDAIHTLRPFMTCCIDLVCDDLGTSVIGIWSLAESFLGLGELEDAVDLMNYVRSRHGWGCDGGCGAHTTNNMHATMCQYSFDYFCDACSSSLTTPRLTRFCFVGHRIVVLDVNTLDIPRDENMFRGSRILLKDCLKLLKEQWNYG